jgi:hypothetical protein
MVITLRVKESFICCSGLWYRPGGARALPSCTPWLPAAAAAVAGDGGGSRGPRRLQERKRRNKETLHPTRYRNKLDTLRDFIQVKLPIRPVSRVVAGEPSRCTRAERPSPSCARRLPSGCGPAGMDCEGLHRCGSG